MEAKFTKGDWKVIGGGIRNSEYDLILKPTQHGSSIFINISTPDAKLIEAAPKLYKMLEYIMKEAESFVERKGGSVSFLNDIKNVLAEARGEEV